MLKNVILALMEYLKFALYLWHLRCHRMLSFISVDAHIIIVIIMLIVIVLGGDGPLLLAHQPNSAFINYLTWIYLNHILYFELTNFTSQLPESLFSSLIQKHGCNSLIKSQFSLFILGSCIQYYFPMYLLEQK